MIDLEPDLSCLSRPSWVLAPRHSLSVHDIIGFLLSSAHVLQDEWEGDASVELSVKGSFFGGGGAPHVDGVGLSVWKLDLTVTVWAVKVRHHIVERTIVTRFGVIKPDFDM